MGKYDSKRVLHLGRYGSSPWNFEFLKQHGAYIIAADKCPVNENPYLNCVNEVIQLDIDNQYAVLDYIKHNNIDAVVTNWYEETYEPCRIYNEALGNSFFHTEKQWHNFMNKDVFRKLCNEYEILTPATFFSGSPAELNESTVNTFTYPLIVKPVDNGGAKGISVVSKKSRLNKAIRFAESKSKSGRIIIEQFIEGKEVSFTYNVQNRKAKLVSSADKYCYKDRNGLSVIPELYIYPCQDYELFEKQNGDKILSLIKEQDLNNCTIFFQGIEKDKTFYLFEAGLRCEGTTSYFINSYFNKQNADNLFFDTLLNVDTDYNIELDDMKLGGHYAAIYIIHLKKGCIRKIEGLDKLKEHKSLLFKAILRKERYRVGNNPLDALFGAFYLGADSRDELFESAKEIKGTIKIKGYLKNSLINNRTF